MYQKEDFDNPIDWVLYNITGKKPSNEVEYDEQLFINSHTLKNAKYPLKFYKNTANNRYNVCYKNNYLCNCSFEEIIDVQKEFDKIYNEDLDITGIGEDFKEKYNKIRTYTLKTTRVRFHKNRGRRLSACCHIGGVSHHLCCLYPNQKKKLIRDFEELRNDGFSLEEIQEQLRETYNSRNKPQGSGRKKEKEELEPTITLDTNGTCEYNNEKFIIDKRFYSLILSIITGD